MCIVVFLKEWHKKCFKCKDCNKTLDSIIACDGPDKDVYCKTCYGKKWGPHGYGFACGSGFLQTDGLTLVAYGLKGIAYTIKANNLFIVVTGTIKYLLRDHFIIQTPRLLKRLTEKDVRGVVEKYLQLNNNWPKER